VAILTEGLVAFDYKRELLATKTQRTNIMHMEFEIALEIDFDPITGKLWDTENGVIFGDEIILVEPGFNSGWNKIDGI
jgi:hypothetical protein